ncbi:MAG: SpoIIE family protein phosphatase [Oscillospiraceae bacterium]|nr:SpoIIE family protein phosphatase [Oscillospiraceae bacterium]
MKEKLKSYFRKLHDKLTADEVFHETEVQGNRLGALILFSSGIILIIILLLTAFGVFLLPWESVASPAIPAVIASAALVVVCRAVKNDAWWLKHLLILGLIIVYANLDSILTHKTALLMIIPVVFSSRYYSKKLTVVTSVVSALAFLASAAWGATNGMINLNIVTFPEGTQMIATGGFLGDAIKNAGAGDPGFGQMLTRNTLLFDYLPRFLMFTLTAIISCNIAGRGRELVTTQHEKDIKTARIESELTLATRIQADMLPNIFPAFPGRTEFDVFATMDPAKEVSGDFYDFFLIDDDHLCLVIADVSGKGVPAALFMMAAKIILANNAMSGKRPAQILTDTNATICSNNREEMFVTVWLGILEISTGKLTAANAGHEYPVVRQPNGRYELLKDKHGFVIGGMDGIKYTEYELYLERGAKLFLYTDGVTEATDASGALYGTERMLAALNAAADAAPKEALRAVRQDIDRFVQDAPQFDDITMLCLALKEDSPAGKTLHAETRQITPEHVRQFVEAILTQHNTARSCAAKIYVAVDEIIANILQYSGAKTLDVSCLANTESITISFSDDGSPYNPLEREDPDVTLTAEERSIGGLGIFMVKNIMDDVDYAYRDGRNVLTIKKNTK